MPNFAEPDFLELLPNEIIVSIFKKLRIRDLLNVAMVSTHYYGIIYGDYFDGEKDDYTYYHCLLHFSKEIIDQYQFIKSKKSFPFTSKKTKLMIEFLKSCQFSLKECTKNKKNLLLFLLRQSLTPKTIDEKILSYIEKANKNSDLLFVLKHIYNSEQIYCTAMSSILECVVKAKNSFSDKPHKFQLRDQSITGEVKVVNDNALIHLEINKTSKAVDYLERNLSLKFHEHIAEISRIISSWLNSKKNPTKKGNLNHKNIKEKTTISGKQKNEINSNKLKNDARAVPQKKSSANKGLIEHSPLTQSPEMTKKKITLDELKKELKSILHVGVFQKLEKTSDLLGKSPKNPNDERQGHLLEYVTKVKPLR